MEIRGKLQSIEKNTMVHLKDFQLATVERIDELFCQGQKRILVADEVGLGKTLIARGVIAKTAVHHEKAGNDIFKIVYICSNQVIANQNIRKLDVFNLRPDRSDNDARLSMQHLRIAEQDNKTKQKGAFAQLIPLTPGTSFSMTNGGGTKDERALMYVILKRIPALSGFNGQISRFMSLNVNNWKETVDWYENRVLDLYNSGTGYPDSVIRDIIKFDSQNHIFDILIQHIEEIRHKEELTESHNSVLMKLRRMFAEISVDMLKPDLVIMDEFQRFKDLIDPESYATETGVIAKKLFSTENLKVLLLSATPYKLYSTLEDIEEAENPEEYYKEFLQVFDFLFDDNNKISHFKNVWSDYSIALREMIQGDLTVLHLKEQAENEMYESMCRTERIMAMDSGDYLNDAGAHPLHIPEGDIHSYLDMGLMLKSIGEEKNLLVDYAKSAPYLMSFMSRYKVKKRAEDCFKLHPEELSKAKSKYLWIDRSCLEHYGELPLNNARLEELKRLIFEQRSELYIWVPPSRPYYELEGAYKDSAGFSKILVFSSWEMVPRVIGSMISYEAERRTVGVVSNDKNLKSTNNTYFTPSKSRYPAARLRFDVSKGGSQLRGMYLFCLMYPSETLAEVYNPIEYLNDRLSLSEIRERVKRKIRKFLDPIIRKYAGPSIRDDKKWYYMAPALLDGKEYFDKWIAEMNGVGPDADDTTEDFGSDGLRAHLRRINNLMIAADRELGRAPGDLADVLTDMAIGSFAVCAFRANGGDLRKSSELAKIFINRFNSQEAISAVMLSYSENEDADGDGYWRNVLRYACDGGFGAMLDEYTHILSESVGFGSSDDRITQVHCIMTEALKIHTASYAVDTYPAFEKRMRGKEYERTFMRSHFAVGFAKSEGSESKNVNRTENIRNAFNSPLRPFVLATTSIGQEGLDFHQYCRKLVHWNLPSNPIDLEQREGRINRYKCLAIRQDLAKRYDNIDFKSDVWQELFDNAAAEARSAGKSELVPYWCAGENQSIKIERIVPMLPFSKDEVNYQRLIKVLSIYRLTMGQARQEELVNYILNSEFDDNEIHSLFFNLSPYSRTSGEWRKAAAKREKVAAPKKKSKRQIEAEELEKQLKACEKARERLTAERKALDGYETVGMIVTHRTRGIGMVTAVNGNIIYVDYDNGDNGVRHKVPDVFMQGHLVSEYAGYNDYIARYMELSRRINDLDKTINDIDSRLEKIRIW